MGQIFKRRDGSDFYKVGAPEVLGNLERGRNTAVVTAETLW